MEILFVIGIVVGLNVIGAIVDSFEVELAVQQVKFEPTFAYGNNSTRTKLNADNLGLDNNENIFKPTFILRKGNHRVDFDYISLDFSGSTTLTKDVNFNNNTYLAGQYIRSDFDIIWMRWGYKYRLFGNNKSYLNLDIDFNSVSVDIRLKGTRSFSFNSLSIPYNEFVDLGFDGNYAFSDRFGIEGKFVSSVNDKAKYIDTYVDLNMNSFLLKNTKLKAGYQYKKLAFDDNQFDGDLRFKGPFVGFNYRF